MLRIDVVTYADKSIASTEKKPVQYIGLVASALEKGKTSLKSLLHNTQADPSTLKFLVGDADERDEMIVLLATLGLKSNINPVIHFVECYNSFETHFSETPTPQAIHEFLSKIVQDYETSFEIATVKLPASMKPPAAINKASFFADSPVQTKEEVVAVDEEKNTHHNSCCVIL